MPQPEACPLGLTRVLRHHFVGPLPSSTKANQDACPPNDPWRTAGHSYPMLDTAPKTHILPCCKVLLLYTWVALIGFRGGEAKTGK